ncbi:MAG: DUF3256 family protein [Bacteroidales bacterium]|nr:DUF3256 family protein [Bacteroidales bacterium]
MRKSVQTINKYLVITVISIISGTISAQNIGTTFLNMPENYIPTLTKQQRFELLEYSKVNRNDSVKNRFGNFSAVQTYDSINQHLIVKTTPISYVELKLLAIKDTDYVIGVIRTVKSPVSISDVKFYDKNWQAVSLHFQMPKATDWLKLDSLNRENIDKKWVYQLLESSFISLNFSKTGSAIEAKNNSLDFLSIEDKKIISPLVDDKKLIFELQNNEWKISEQ